jgi:hypothetical protein
MYILAGLYSVRFQVLTAASMKMTAFFNIAPCSLEVDQRFIALVMQGVRTSETSVYFNESTRRYIPESCHLQFISRSIKVHDNFWRGSIPEGSKRRGSAESRKVVTGSMATKSLKNTLLDVATIRGLSSLSSSSLSRDWDLTPSIGPNRVDLPEDGSRASCRNTVPSF